MAYLRSSSGVGGTLARDLPTNTARGRGSVTRDMISSSRSAHRSNRQSMPVVAAPVARRASAAGSSTSCWNSCANPAAVTSSTSRPSTPSVNTSAMPPARLATTGVPDARASISTCGRPSWLLASTSASARASWSMTSSWPRAPMNVTRSVTARSPASPWSRSSSGPSPTIVRRAAGTRATASIRTSACLTGTRRPTNTRSSPGTFDPDAVSASGGVRAPLGTTVTSSRPVHPLTVSARCPLGVTTAVAAPIDRFRTNCMARMRAPVAGCSWNSSKVRLVRPRRDPRSHAGSPATFTITGRPMSRPAVTASAVRPVGVDDIALPAVRHQPCEDTRAAQRPRPSPRKPHDRRSRRPLRLVGEREHPGLVAPLAQLRREVGRVRRRPSDVGREDPADDQDAHRWSGACREARARKETGRTIAPRERR